jgi:hypothetical protein
LPEVGPSARKCRQTTKDPAKDLAECPGFSCQFRQNRLGVTARVTFRAASETLRFIGFLRTLQFPPWPPKNSLYFLYLRSELFIYRRRRFDAEIIGLCVRWYITYRLSYRDLVAMMAERGISVSHDDSSLGDSLCAGVREAMKPLRATREYFLACR